jgi:hypothetical protein
MMTCLKPPLLLVKRNYVSVSWSGKSSIASMRVLNRNSNYLTFGAEKRGRRRVCACILPKRSDTIKGKPLNASRIRIIKRVKHHSLINGGLEKDRKDHTGHSL